MPETRRKHRRLLPILEKTTNFVILIHPLLLSWGIPIYSGSCSRRRWHRISSSNLVIAGDRHFVLKSFSFGAATRPTGRTSGRERGGGGRVFLRWLTDARCRHQRVTRPAPRQKGEGAGTRICVQCQRQQRWRSTLRQAQRRGAHSTALIWPLPPNSGPSSTMLQTAFGGCPWRTEQQCHG